MDLTFYLYMCMYRPFIYQYDAERKIICKIKDKISFSFGRGSYVNPVPPLQRLFYKQLCKGRLPRGRLNLSQGSLYLIIYSNESLYLYMYLTLFLFIGATNFTYQGVHSSAAEY